MGGSIAPPPSWLRYCAHQIQSIGWDADVNHTQTIGVESVKLLGGIYPPHPPGFRHPCPRLHNICQRSAFLYPICTNLLMHSCQEIPRLEILLF